MPYEWVNNDWVWAGTTPEPVVGESKAEYEARTGASPTSVSVPVDPQFPFSRELNYGDLQVSQSFWEATGYTTGLVPTEGGGAFNALMSGIPGVDTILLAARLASLGYHVGSTIQNIATGGDGEVSSQLGAGAIVDGIPISGPGVPEPPAQLVAKQWVVMLNTKQYGAFYMYFFRLLDGRIMSYHPYKGWKIWRPKKPLAVMYRGHTTLSQAIKVQNYLDKLWRNVARKTKALKLSKRA